jgi:hypothetical protein
MSSTHFGPKPRLPIGRLSEDAMRELVVDIVSGKVLTSAQVPDNMCSLVFFPAAMGAFSPPPELRKELLGTTEPPESLEGEPPKPPHPGYGGEEPKLPPPPELVEVSSELVSAVEWGESDPQELEIETLRIQDMNAKAQLAWKRERGEWETALAAFKEECEKVDASYAQEVAEWKSTLDAHETKVAERKRLHDDWVARHDELFSEWMDDLGVMWGHTRDSFPRGVNGFPMFYVVGTVHKEDWNRVRLAVEREIERSQTFEV